MTEVAKNTNKEYEQRTSGSVRLQSSKTDSLVTQIKQLDLKSCPQTILKIEGNINFFQEKIVKGTREMKQSWRKRLIDVANGASIENFEVVRKDRILFTFDGAPHLQVGIYKSTEQDKMKVPHNSVKGARFFFQTKGSSFMYEVYFENCMVLVQQNVSDQKLHSQKKQKHHYDPHASLSIVQMMEQENKKIFGTREKVTQRKKETKTAIRKKKKENLGKN